VPPPPRQQIKAVAIRFTNEVMHRSFGVGVSRKIDALAPIFAALFRSEGEDLAV
jgi:hypothetical protein